MTKMNWLNKFMNKYHTIIIFIMFVCSLMYVSFINEELFNDYKPINKKDLKNLITLEQEKCTKKNVCGLIDNVVVPCPPISCNDTCICHQ